MKVFFIIFPLLLAALFIFTPPALAVCSCAPAADYGDPANKTAWCACAASCGDNGSLIAGSCPQAPQTNTCQADCKYCPATTDKCGNYVYQGSCSYSSCTSEDAYYTCTSSGNSVCQGSYRCGTVCAPTPKVCTPGAFDPNRCRKCSSDGTYWGIEGSDYGPNTGSSQWCACATLYSGQTFATQQGCITQTPSPTPKSTSTPTPKPISTISPTTKPTPTPQPVTITGLTINGVEVTPPSGKSGQIKSAHY